MTKDIKKKRSIDWIVFWIWALTAALLLLNLHSGYLNTEFLMRHDIHTSVPPLNSIIDSPIALKEDDSSTETTEQKQEPESEEIIQQSPYKQELDNALLRLIIVALCVVLTTILFLGIRGRSNVLTAILIVLILVNMYLIMKQPVFLYH